MRTVRLLPLSVTLASLLLAVLPQVWGEDQEPDYGTGDVRHVEYFGGLRIDGGIAPGPDKITTVESTNQLNLNDPSQNTTNKLTNKPGLAINASVYWDSSLDGGFGWAFVPGLYYRQVRGISPNENIKFRALGVQFATGPSLTLGKVNFELTPYFGVGADAVTQTVDVPGIGGMQRDSGAGRDIHYGGTLTVDWVSNDNVYLGATGGMEWFHSLMNMSDNVSSNNGIELDKQRALIDGKGLLLQLTFAFWY